MHDGIHKKKCTKAKIERIGRNDIDTLQDHKNSIATAINSIKISEENVGKLLKIFNHT